jgi:hypothetical protein
MIIARYSAKIFVYLFVSQIVCVAALLPILQERAIAQNATQIFVQTQTDNTKETNVDTSGTWIGTASSTDSKQIFRYEWSISQNGQDVQGRIKLSTLDKRYYAVYKINGNLTGNVLSFAGNEFIENVPPPNSSWCLAAGNLKLSSKGDFMEGIWESNPVPGGCPREAKGNVRLQRKQ